MENKFGLLGRSLGHSLSPQLHAMLGSYEYRLYEIEPDLLASFLAGSDVRGLNVTIPYKKSVLPFCRELSDAARRIGSVNTLLRQPEGWFGDNTDYAGFRAMVEQSGISLRGAKTLVFGSGGASLAVRAVLEDLGASPIVTISRSGPYNYENFSLHWDAEILINTTPLGMYPHVETAPADIRQFPRCRAVFDIVYNPLRTNFLMQAEKLNIPCFGGLFMLAAQAQKSAALFTGTSLPGPDTAALVSKLERQAENIILIGMPGAGKTTVGQLLAQQLGRPFCDADEFISSESGMSIQEIFSAEGEDGFRKRETAVLSALGAQRGAVIATGGGCVTRQENYPLLHRNGRIIWLRRPLSALPGEGRPLSQKHSAEALWAQRKELYRAFADHIVNNSGAPVQTAAAIEELLS